MTGHMRWLTSVPLGLTLLRAALGPVVLVCALLGPSNVVFSLCLVAAFLSDVFDGIIARRLGIASEGLRRLDSIADSIFYVCACVAAYHLHPQAIEERWVPLSVLAGVEVLRYAFDFAKYRRETSYHMWSSKLWGIFLFAGFLSLLGFGQDGVLVSLAIYAGIVADLEGLLISVLLRQWRHDVPSFVHALALRRAGRNQP